MQSLPRLFWKLQLSFWCAMLASFVIGASYLELSGHPRPPDFPGIALVPALSALLASLMVSGFLAWYLSRPLQRLRWALRRVAEGRFDTRVGTLFGGRRDEIVDLGIDIDRMAAQLQQLTAARQRLLHDVSHELRSPLARMQAAIGLLRQDPSRLEPMLDRIDREAERLDALIEEMLTLHRLAAGAAGANGGQRERVDIVELLADIADDAQFEAAARGCTVRLDSGGPFVADVNGELIYRALENVVRNALKYTAPNTEIVIAALVLDADATLQVTVADRGPGVPADMLEAIFEPFVRVEAHAAAVPGVGLGLAIAQRAVAAHEGSIRALARDGGGLVVELRLPRLPRLPPAGSP